jgi:fatty acid desaturase
MEKHRRVEWEKIKAKRNRLAVILFTDFIGIAFISWAFVQGQVLLVFVGLIVLLTWMFYFISTQPIGQITRPLLTIKSKDFERLR